MLPFKSLMVSGLTSRSLIHFQLIFVYGARQWSAFILLHMVVQFLKYHLLKTLSNVFIDSFVVNWAYTVLILSCFIFLCQYQAVLTTTVLWYSLKSGSRIPQALFFFVKIGLAIWGLSKFKQMLQLFIVFLWKIPLKFL